MKLSEHFTLEELTFTQVRDAENKPSGQVLLNLEATASRMEEVRALLGNKPILVTSGFRSQFVNKIVGGSLTSAHMRGHAVDFIAPSAGTPLSICRLIAASELVFDQLIFEETWVHLSFDPRMRKEVLTKKRHGSYSFGLPSGQEEGEEK